MDRLNTPPKRNKRNRHTGRINFATADILKNGTPVMIGNTTYVSMRYDHKGRTLVRA